MTLGLTVGRAAACGGGVILALGAGVFALRDAPDEAPSAGTPVFSTAIPPSKDLVEPDPPAPVVAPPEVPDEDGIGVGSLLLVPDDRYSNDDATGIVRDTGSYMDPDYDWGDYSFSPASDIGEFLDPDAD